jgi:Zn-dependent metalloprotease
MEFLHTHGDGLGIGDPSKLRFVRLWQSRSGTHVRFQQTYNSLPVIGALLDVHLDRDMEVCMVTGIYHERVRPAHPGARRPGLTRKDAIRRAIDDLGRDPRLRAQVKCDELIYPAGGGFRMVYKIVLPASRPLGNWIYLFDPFNGSILNSYNTMRFAKGQGRVYLTSPAENHSYTVVPLDRLCRPIELKGEHVVVMNEDFPEARSEDGSFLYAPADTHFDEVMAYYHVDRAAAFFTKLDPALEKMTESNGCLRAFVHAGDAMDNAYYDPSTHAIYLGDGGGVERFNDLAKEAAVVYHEYTHAVLDHVNPHLKGTEADALHEGYADYYGCSLTDDPQIGEWVIASFDRPYLRDLTNGKRYPNGLEGEAHADGEIWGGVCWDLRRALGVEKADRLAYESIHFLPELAQFRDAALGVMQAGENMYSRGDVNEIVEVMATRGLRTFGVKSI